MRGEHDDKEVKKYLLMSKEIKSRSVGHKPKIDEKMELKIIGRRRNHLYCNSMIVGKKEIDIPSLRCITV